MSRVSPALRSGPKFARRRQRSRREATARRRCNRDSKSGRNAEEEPAECRRLYAKGISNATLGSFEATAKRSYLSAGSKAKTARDLHQRVLDLDPTFDDARLSVGGSTTSSALFQVSCARFCGRSESAAPARTSESNSSRRRRQREEFGDRRANDASRCLQPRKKIRRGAAHRGRTSRQISGKLPVRAGARLRPTAR